MRITTISSFIASPVAAVVAVACVAFAGIAVRPFLHLTHMRKRMGYWRQRCLSGITDREGPQGQLPLGLPLHGLGLGLVPVRATTSLALCRVPNPPARARANRRG